MTPSTRRVSAGEGPTGVSMAAPHLLSLGADPEPASPAPSSFGQILAHPGSWSRLALAWSVVISALVFVFGNLAFVGAAPVATVGLNLLATMVIFGGMRAITRLLPARLPSGWRISAVVLGLAVGAALRGIALFQLATLVGFEQGSSPAVRALVSLSVFGPGLVLSVLLVSVSTRWRHSESSLRDRADQLKSTRASARESAEASIRSVIAGIEKALEEGVEALRRADSARATHALKRMLGDVVKPLSITLASPTEPAKPTPLAPSRPAKVAEVVRMAHRLGPVAPLASGVLFTLMLLPRALDGGNILEGLGFSALLGLAVSLGLTLTNRLSKALSTRWPNPLITLALITQVMLVGLFLALMTATLTTSDFGLGALSLVAPITLLLVALLVGGTRAINQHALVQRTRSQNLAELLRIELSQAQSYHWQQRRALSNWLHGPVQASINSALLRLSQAPSGTAWQKERDDIVADIAMHRREIHDVLTTTSNLRVAIERISHTWEGVTTLEWHVAEGLAALEGSHHQGAIADVLVEAVFNAVRHASPPVIQIYLTNPKPAEVRLRVIHRGSLPTRGPAPGLGTKMCALLTLEYSLTEHAPESPETIALSLAPGESAVVFDARFLA